MKNDILTCPEMRDTFQFQYTSCWYPKKLILRQTSNTSPTKHWGWKSPYTCRFPFCHGGTPSHHPFKLFGIFHEINKEFPCYKPSSYWGIPMAMDPAEKWSTEASFGQLPWPAVTGGPVPSCLWRRGSCWESPPDPLDLEVASRQSRRVCFSVGDVEVEWWSGLMRWKQCHCYQPWLGMV